VWFATRVVVVLKCMRGDPFGSTVGLVDLGEEKGQESSGFVWR
jgi:hypothetical protein